MALSVQLLTEYTAKQAGAMSSTRLPGYSSGLSSLSTTSRRSGPVGPNPLPKRLGALAKGRTPGPSTSPRHPPTGINATSVRIAKQTNSAGSDPRPFDRNLNNTKPIKEIRRSQNHASSSDSKPDSGGTAGSDDSKRHLPPALSVDFIKHALSSSKQMYSAQEIKAKAETAWKQSGRQNNKKSKPKTGSSKDNTTASRIEPVEVPKSKLFESIQNEGFGPRVKSKALNGQLKVLHMRLGGDSAIDEETEEDLAESPAPS